MHKGVIPELPNGWELIEHGDTEPHAPIMIAEYGAKAWRVTNGISGRVHVEDDSYRVAKIIKPVKTEW